MGKLLERMVHNDFSPHIKDNYFSNTMYRFHPHLSTRDILLQLKEATLSKMTDQLKCSILALDTKGAFDNITHEAILQGLTSYNYVTTFLTNRTATAGIRHLHSDTFQAIPKGTPSHHCLKPSKASDMQRTLSTSYYGPLRAPRQDALQTATFVAQQNLQACNLGYAPRKIGPPNTKQKNNHEKH